jgi:hypothetical protein
LNRRPPQPRDRAALTRHERKTRNRKKPDYLAGFRNLLMLVLIAQSLRVAFASPRLRLKEISVQGTQRITPADVAREGQVQLGQNVFRVNLVKVSERLTQDPIIRDAVVTRDLPNRLNVEVHERTPAYQISCQGTRWDVDSDNVVFRKNKAYLQGHPILELPAADVPPLGQMLRGELARAYADSLKLAKKNSLDLRHLRVDQAGELWLNIATSPPKSNGESESKPVVVAENAYRLKVRVGRVTDLPQKFRDIHQALQGWPDLTTTAAHLDVMCPGRPAYMSAAKNPDDGHSRNP